MWHLNYLDFTLSTSALIYKEQCERLRVLRKRKTNLNTCVISGFSHVHSNSILRPTRQIGVHANPRFRVTFLAKLAVSRNKCYRQTVAFAHRCLLQIQDALEHFSLVIFPIRPKFRCFLLNFFWNRGVGFSYHKLL